MVRAKPLRATKLGRAEASATKSGATKSGATKSVASKTTVKKTVVKKTAVKKTAVKKTVVKKDATKREAKDGTAKKVATKIVTAPKAATEKKTVKDAAPKKSVAPKKMSTPAKKTIPKKVATQVPVKKAAAKPIAAKLQSTTQGDSTTITVTPREVNSGPEIVMEERRLAMTPPPRPVRHGRRSSTLKPIKGAPVPLVVNESENPWSAAELKSMRSELMKELTRLKSELVDVEGEMEDLIAAAGVGAGDDQADAGTKTFEREHEMSLVYNARDMVLQTERAIERIETKTYGRCEECSQAIGKERLQVFPRATLCMACKQKEERR
jgi:RNA polymerase-binding transcription factor DksA